MFALIDEIGFVYKWMDGYVFETIVCIYMYILFINVIISNFFLGITTTVPVCIIIIIIKFSNK